MTDLLTTVTQAFPAANANNNTAGFQIGGNKGTTPTAGVITVGPSDGRLLISTPALPAMTGGFVDFTVQDSADGVTYADAVGYGTLRVTGTAGGPAAWKRRLAIHPGTRPFVRLKAAVDAAGGNNTALSYTFQLLV